MAMVSESEQALAKELVAALPEPLRELVSDHGIIDDLLSHGAASARIHYGDKSFDSLMEKLKIVGVRAVFELVRTVWRQAVRLEFSEEESWVKVYFTIAS